LLSAREFENVRLTDWKEEIERLKGRKEHVGLSSVELDNATSRLSQILENVLENWSGSAWERQKYPCGGPLQAWQCTWKIQDRQFMIPVHTLGPRHWINQYTCH